MRVLLLLMIGGALGAQTPAPAPAKPKPATPAAAQPAAKPAGTPAAAAAAKPAAGDPVVLTAGTVKLTKSEFDNIMKNLPEGLKTQIGGDSPESRRKLAEQLGDVLVYASEARKLKLYEKPSAKVQMYLQEQGLYAGLLYQHLMETSKPNDEAAKAWYDSHKSEYEQAKARHILVRFKGSRVPLRPGQKEMTEEEALAKANALRERVAKGEDFAAVAKTDSDDAGSGAQGGDLGTFGHGRMVPVFDEAAFKQPIGQVGEPVKSQFGYHIIQVQERTAKSFDEVKAELEKRLQTEGAQKAMEALKTASKPNLDEVYFGKPAAAAPAVQITPSPAK